MLHRRIVTASGEDYTKAHHAAVIAAEIRAVKTPYLIWSYDYSHASAGPKALHRLCHELNEVGERAYVGPWVTNAEWSEPKHEPAFSGEWIAVYPEIVKGNPWGAPRVARWVLNTPGKLGGDTSYDPSEIVFTWSPIFTDAPILRPPTLETTIYYDRHLPRSGELFYVGKGYKTREFPGATEITLEMRLNRDRLADVLNRATVLYSFDDLTGMADLARLCGCPVVMPSGERLDPAGYREAYMAQCADFPAQLREFIRTTQLVLA